MICPTCRQESDDQGQEWKMSVERTETDIAEFISQEEYEHNMAMLTEQITRSSREDSLSWLDNNSSTVPNTSTSIDAGPQRTERRKKRT